MTKHISEAAIVDLATRALDETLPKSEWNHAAHFALALWCLRHRPQLAEPEPMRSIITRLNEAHGTPNTDSEGYHHTITCASLRAAGAVHDNVPAEVPLNMVLSDLLAGPFGRSGWILEFWTEGRLFSVEGRRDWIEPDRAPLPF